MAAWTSPLVADIEVVPPPSSALMTPKSRLRQRFDAIEEYFVPVGRVRATKRTPSRTGPPCQKKKRKE